MAWGVIGDTGRRVSWYLESRQSNLVNKLLLLYAQPWISCFYTTKILYSEIDIEHQLYSMAFSLLKMMGSTKNWIVSPFEQWPYSLLAFGTMKLVCWRPLSTWKDSTVSDFIDSSARSIEHNLHEFHLAFMCRKLIPSPRFHIWLHMATFCPVND